MIYVNNLEKSFGKNKVLKGVNEHIKKGENGIRRVVVAHLVQEKVHF